MRLELYGIDQGGRKVSGSADDGTSSKAERSRGSLSRKDQELSHGDESIWMIYWRDVQAIIAGIVRACNHSVLGLLPFLFESFLDDLFIENNNPSSDRARSQQ